MNENNELITKMKTVLRLIPHAVDDLNDAWEGTDEEFEKALNELEALMKQGKDLASLAEKAGL
jgi:archaellum component FlaC